MAISRVQFKTSIFIFIGPSFFMTCIQKAILVPRLLQCFLYKFNRLVFWGALQVRKKCLITGISCLTLALLYDAQLNVRSSGRKNSLIPLGLTPARHKCNAPVLNSVIPHLCTLNAPYIYYPLSGVRLF